MDNEYVRFKCITCFAVLEAPDIDPHEDWPRCEHDGSVMMRDTPRVDSMTLRVYRRKPERV